MLLHHHDPRFDRDDANLFGALVIAALLVALFAATVYSAEPDTRPVVYAYVSPGCWAGEVLKRQIKAGKLSRFRIEVTTDAPDWVTSQEAWCPTLHYQGADGHWRTFRDFENGVPVGWTKRSPDKFVARWEFWNNKKSN